MLRTERKNRHFREPPVSDKTFSIQILCTGNSSRSVMAEALFNVLGKGKFHAYSAGSHPSGAVNPFAIERCDSLGYDTSELRSQAGMSSPPPTPHTWIL